MLTDNKITEIFSLVDDFCKEFENVKEGHPLTETTAKKRRNRSFALSGCEVITILILFHAMQVRSLKFFYTRYVQIHMQKEFPKTVSYNRFVVLQQKMVMPMAIFLKTRCLGKFTGVSFIDSTPMRACHIRREKIHKV